MRPAMAIFGVIAALLPVLYCGGLVYHFLNFSGSVQEARSIGLGPTLLGLRAVGLLFAIALLIKIARIFARSRSGGGPDGPTYGGKSDFDADAVIARYKARQAAETTIHAPVVPPTPNGRGSVRPTRFGRRSR